MKNNCYSKRFPAQVPLCSPHQAQSVEKVVVDGRVLSRTIFVTDDPRSPERDRKAHEFYLENLLDAGTDLKPMQLSASAFTAVASMPIVSDFKQPNTEGNVPDAEKSK